MPTILTVSCCAVITTPTLHQPIFYVITAPYPNCRPVLRRERFFYTPGWMAVEYLHGVVNSALPDADELAALLYHLHQQPRFGWRIALSPLLAQYWSCCDPARRTPFWLRRLKQLQKNGEPRPLRLAPLHMDVHGDNIVLTSAGLRLIDWEYAGDGDIALELAAVWVEDERQHRQLADAYAARARIDARQLWRQIRLWHPWSLC